MCCFSRPVKHVSSTSIFARMSAPGRQVLAYSMTVEAAEPLAMILPLPTPAASGEEALRFIDLSGYGGLFGDLDSAFPTQWMQSRSGGLFAPRSQRQAPLVVHDVGQFEASFVPTQADFSRLDPRFRLDDAVFRRLPRYADYGFAVFQLKGFDGGFFRRIFRRSSRKKFHPMALEFATRDPGRLFFPAVHVHDGEVSPRASFDHALYAQTDDAPGALLDDEGEGNRGSWDAGGAAARVARVEASKGVVAAFGDLFKWSLQGEMTNGDRWAPVVLARAA